MSDKTRTYFDIGVYDKKSLVSVKISGNKPNISLYKKTFFLLGQSKCHYGDCLPHEGQKMVFNTSFRRGQVQKTNYLPQ